MQRRQFLQIGLFLITAEMLPRIEVATSNGLLSAIEQARLNFERDLARMLEMRDDLPEFISSFEVLGDENLIERVKEWGREGLKLTAKMLDLKHKLTRRFEISEELRELMSDPLILGNKDIVKKAKNLERQNLKIIARLLGLPKKNVTAAVTEYIASTK